MFFAPSEDGQQHFLGHGNNQYSRACIQTRSNGTRFTFLFPPSPSSSCGVNILGQLRKLSDFAREGLIYSQLFVPFKFSESRSICGFFRHCSRANAYNSRDAKICFVILREVKDRRDRCCDFFWLPVRLQKDISFLPAAKPSGHRMVRVVVVVGGGLLWGHDLEDRPKVKVNSRST